MEREPAGNSKGNDNKEPFGLLALWRAYRSCRKGKRTTRDTQRYEARLLDRLVSSRDALARFAWRPSRTLAFVVSSPKLREIHAAPFSDRVVHHLLTDRLARIYEPVFIHDSYANRVGKGTHAAVERLQAFMRQAVGGHAADVGTAVGADLAAIADGGIAAEAAPAKPATPDAYALQLDIANFFNSIHRPTLFGLLQQRLVRAVRRQGLARDEARALQAHCRALLEADPAAGVRRKGPPGLFEQVPPHKRLGALGPGVGLPIGNLTSQFFANVYLNELDQFIKHTLKARWYVRYVDDFVLLHHAPAQLTAWRAEIECFLAERLRLKLKERAEPRPLAAGVDFLGYVIRPFYKLVRRRVIRHLYARLAEFERRHVRPNALRLPPTARDLLRAQVASYLGHLRHAHSYRLWLHTLERFPWLSWVFDQPENAIGAQHAGVAVGAASAAISGGGIAAKAAPTETSTLNPDGVPMGILPDATHQTGPEGIGDNITGEGGQILVPPHGVVVKARLPDSLSWRHPAAVDGGAAPGLEPFDQGGKRSAPQFEQPVQVVWHQHEGQGMREAGRVAVAQLAHDEVGGKEMGKQRLAGEGNGGDQIGPADFGYPAFAQVNRVGCLCHERNDSASARPEGGNVGAALAAKANGGIAAEAAPTVMFPQGDGVGGASAPIGGGEIAVKFPQGGGAGAASAPTCRPPLRPSWEPASVSGLAGQYRAFVRRYPDACVLMQVGKNWLAAGEQAVPLSHQSGVVTARRPGLGRCIELPAHRLALARQKLKRASIPHILVAQTGAFKTGFKRRAMVLIWRPTPDPLNPCGKSPGYAGVAVEV